MGIFMKNYKNTKDIHSEDADLFSELFFIGELHNVAETVASVTTEYYSEGLVEKASNFLSKILEILKNIFNSILKVGKAVWDKFFKKDTMEVKVEIKSNNKTAEILNNANIKEDKIEETVQALVSVGSSLENTSGKMLVDLLTGIDSTRHFIQSFIKMNDTSDDSEGEEDDTHKISEQKLLEFKKIDIKLLEFKKEIEPIKNTISKVKTLDVKDDDSKEVKDAKNKVVKAIDNLKDVTAVISNRESEFNKKLNAIRDKRSKGTPAPSEISVIVIKGREKLVGAIKVSSDVYHKVKGALSNILKRKDRNVLDDIFKSYTGKKEVYITDIIHDIYDKKPEIIIDILKENSVSGNCDVTSINTFLIDILNPNKSPEVMKWYDDNFIQKLQKLSKMKEIYGNLKSNIDIGKVKDGDEFGNSNKAKGIEKALSKTDVIKTLDELLTIEGDDKLKKYFVKYENLLKIKETAGMLKSGVTAMTTISKFEGDAFDNYLTEVMYKDTNSHNEYIHDLFEKVLAESQKALETVSQLSQLSNGIKDTMSKLSKSSIDIDARKSLDKMFRDIAQMTMACVSVPRITYDSCMQVMGSTQTFVMTVIGLRYTIQALFEEYLQKNGKKSKNIKQ